MAQMPVSAQADHTVYGCFPMLIGATVEHKLAKRLVLSSGRVLTAGQKMHVDVQDITRHLDLHEHVTWTCKHPSCQGQSWKSKAELVNSHESTKILKSKQEVHCFYAVAYAPFAPAKPETKDKHGEVIAEAIPERQATIVLLSDEDAPT